MNSVTPTASPRRDARRNHERLLVEARVLFAERGIDAPLDELAARAGVGAGTVYRHFASRDALVRELYDTAVANLHELAPEILGAESGWRSVELYLERLAAWLAESPYLPAVMRRVAELDPDYRPGAEFADAINGLVVPCAGRGHAPRRRHGRRSQRARRHARVGRAVRRRLPPVLATAAHDRARRATGPARTRRRSRASGSTSTPSTTCPHAEGPPSGRGGCALASRADRLRRGSAAARTSTRFAHGSSTLSVRPSSRVGHRSAPSAPRARRGRRRSAPGCRPGRARVCAGAGRRRGCSTCSSPCGGGTRRR